MMIQVLISLGSLALLVMLTRTLTTLFKIPGVLGEILLGILIGPTFLGNLFPVASHLFFPITGAAGMMLQQLSRVAMLLMLFTAGMEINLKALREESTKILPITLGSFIIPFLIGISFVMLAPNLFSASGETQVLLALFVGVSLAISALPVIIRILMDIGLYHSRIGVLTVASASLMDILGWASFTLILACLNPLSIHNAVQMISSHSTFLCLLLGVLVGNLSKIPENFKKRLHQFVIPILSPLFFVSIGSRVNFAENMDLMLITLIILVASTSKILGSFVGGKSSGLTITDAFAVGFSLNARGAMEIMLSKQALEAGLIDTKLFVALVIMALFTSLLSAPAIKFLISNRDKQKGILYASSFNAETEQVVAG